ncbi:hypothetical protein QO001_006125 [Methylobacterium brachiatum]|uniref:Uncharacterized protein n=1 Tax=Methylobacterium brachiatum TaxID=269660 RepID=A0AAJ1WY15_9HYPH|nr:hypothetical protein [Methylobacterium brachiatum]
MPRPASERSSQGNGRVSAWPQARPYSRRAIREALEAGFTTEELSGVLGDRDPTDLVPPHRHEAVPEYGRRAAGEIMVRYVQS